MTFRDFLNVARTLALGTTEAEWRSAVSRAYYAVFHESGSLLRNLGFRVPRVESGHAYVWRRLSNSGNFEVDKAGRALNDFRGRRNHADYQEQPPVSQVQAEDAVKLAEDILEAIDAALVEPVRTQITEAMKIYERDILKEETWKPRAGRHDFFHLHRRLCRLEQIRHAHAQTQGDPVQSLDRGRVLAQLDLR